jgi:hypothetical protein
MFMKEKTIPALRIEIRPSTMIPGEVGLFVVRKTPKGEVIAPASSYKETAYPWSTYKKLDKLTRKKVDGFCSATEDSFYAPSDFNYLQINWFMNHSCEPNVGFNSKGDFIAIRTIKKDEELAWDYSYNETNPRFRMKCGCKTKSCRGTITGEDWRVLAQDKNKYPYLSKQIQKLYTKKQK